MGGNMRKKDCANDALDIQNKKGGEIYILGDFPSQKFWHVVVKRKGKYWDKDGSKTESQLKKKYPKLDLKKATRKDKSNLHRIVTENKILF